MNFSKILTIVTLSSLCVHVIGEETEEYSKVVNLTRENFESFVKDNKHTLVKFFAPWCGHCKRMAPEFVAAAETLHTMGASYKLADVDATVEKELAEQYEIRGYPTLKFFRDGKPEEYDGGRTKDEIVSWLEVMTDPATSEVESVERALEMVIERQNPLAVIVATKTDDELWRTVKETAESHRTLAKWYLVPQEEEKFVIYRQSDSERIDIEIIPKTENDILAVVNMEKIPPFGQVNQTNFHQYMANGNDFVWFAGDQEMYNKHKAEITTVAKEYRKGYNFVWIDSVEHRPQIENFIGESEFPAIVISSMESKGRYVFSSDINAANLGKWMKQVESGEEKKVYKSEEEPELNDEPVKVVVGSSFENSVFKKDKDVFLEIYAPWCGHCKKLEPVYKEFAEKLETVAPHVIVAKMDGTANEIATEGFGYQGFPTIYFVKAGERTPIPYSEERSMEGLVNFLKQHSSKEVTIELETEDTKERDEL